MPFHCVTFAGFHWVAHTLSCYQRSSTKPSDTVGTTKKAEEKCASMGARLYQPRTLVALKFLEDNNLDVTDQNDGSTDISWPFPYSTNGYGALGLKWENGTKVLKYR